MATGNVLSIAALADTLPSLAANGGPNMNPGKPSGRDFTRLLLINLFIAENDGFPSAGINQFTSCQPTCYSGSE